MSLEWSPSEPVSLEHMVWRLYFEGVAEWSVEDPIEGITYYKFAPNQYELLEIEMQ